MVPLVPSGGICRGHGIIIIYYYYKYLLNNMSKRRFPRATSSVRNVFAVEITARAPNGYDVIKYQWSVFRIFSKEFM